MEAREKQAYLKATPQQVSTARTLMSAVLVQLQALGMFYQVAGWKTGGGINSEASLYERLGSEVPWDATNLARKIVGYFGPEAIDAQTNLRGVQLSLARWEAASPTVQGQALQAENDLQHMLVMADRKIRGANAMTLGLSLFLKTLAEKHEGNLLALQQQETSSRVASGTAEKHFHDNPEKREVQQLVRGPLPPTPVDIQKGPGGEGASTLNRFVIDSLDPRIAPAGAENNIRKSGE